MSNCAAISARRLSGMPHLLTGADGSVTFEFKVPDSVTSWNVWVHAITQGFEIRLVHREAQSVKELMVRPYLPRFLREGDQAEIKVVVNNASDNELKGTLNFDIIDVATDQSILSQFGLSKSDTDRKAFHRSRKRRNQSHLPYQDSVQSRPDRFQGDRDLRRFLRRRAAPDPDSARTHAPDAVALRHPERSRLSA